jgi:hypothetical protein
MDWNVRYATIGETGIDYSKATPCSRDKTCGFCKHLDKIELSNRDENGKAMDKDHAATIKMIRKLHEDGVYKTPRPALTPKKVK